jgi:hypothetical protein
VVLTVAVFGRSRVKRLPLIVLLVGCWSGILTTVWVGQAVVQIAGHNESCRYVNSTVQHNQDTNDVARTSTRWVVDCPDGRHTFGTTQNVEVSNQDGSITLRTAGPAFTVLPVGQANDYTLWFMSIPGTAILIGSLIIALLTPRRPEDAEPSTVGVTDHVPADGD